MLSVGKDQFKVSNKNRATIMQVVPVSLFFNLQEVYPQDISPVDKTFFVVREEKLQQRNDVKANALYFECGTHFNPILLLFLFFMFIILKQWVWNNSKSSRIVGLSSKRARSITFRHFIYLLTFDLDVHNHRISSHV